MDVARNIYDDIVTKLVQHRLHLVVKQMRAAGEQAGYTAWNESLSRTEEVLNPLTLYLQRGTEDKERNKIVTNLCNTLLKELDLFLFQQLCHSYFSHPMSESLSKIKRWRDEGISVTPAAVLRSAFTEDLNKTKLRNRLFHVLFASEPHREDLERELCPWIESEDFSEAYIMNLATVSAALFLSVMEVFCPIKMRLLYLLSQHSNAKLAGWSFAAYLLCCEKHHTRIQILGDKRSHLLPPFPDKNTHGTAHKQVYTFLSYLYTSFSTEEYYSRFKKTILPQLKDAARKMEFMLGENRDIEQMLANEEKESEMAEIMDSLEALMPKERDFFYFSTAEMPRNSLFYQDLSNWIMPFDPHHAALNPEDAKIFITLLPFIQKEKKMCSSDLYAFALTIQWKQTAAMMGPLDEQLSSLQKDVQQESWSQGSFEEGVSDFVFSIYRLYKLHPNRSSLQDPFEQEPLLIDTYPCSEVELSYDEVRHLSGSLVKNRFYHRALLLLQKDLQGAQDYRMAALIAEKDDPKANAKSIERYLLRAHELEPSHPGTLLKLADVYLNEGNRKREAKEMLNQLQDKDSDQIAVLSKWALLLSRLGEDDKALDLYFKGFYISDGKDLKIVRGLARLLFKMERYHDAMEKWGLLEEEELLSIDCIGYAHSLVAMREFEKAMKVYRLWMRQTKSGSLLEWRKYYVKPVSTVYAATEWDLLYDSLDPNLEGPSTGLTTN